MNEFWNNSLSISEKVVLWKSETIKKYNTALPRKGG